MNRAGLSRKHILDAARASVERLGTYVEFQIQRMDPDVPRDEVMRALSDVAEVGLARYIGASSVSLPSCGFCFLCYRTLTVAVGDACVRDPSAPECRARPWTAPVYIHAKLLQPALQRRRARDDALLPRCRCQLHSGTEFPSRTVSLPNTPPPHKTISNSSISRFSGPPMCVEC